MTMCCGGNESWPGVEAQSIGMVISNTILEWIIAVWYQVHVHVAASHVTMDKIINQLDCHALVQYNAMRFCMGIVYSKY